LFSPCMFAPFMISPAGVVGGNAADFGFSDQEAGGIGPRGDTHTLST
jgi:hypothetical protein